MSKKDDLKSALDEAGVEYEATATNKQLEALLEGVAEQEAEFNAEAEAEAQTMAEEVIEEVVKEDLEDSVDEDVTEEVTEAAPEVVATEHPAPVKPELKKDDGAVDVTKKMSTADGLKYGIICTECGYFRHDPMGNIIVPACPLCKGIITRGMQRDVKGIVNSTKVRQGLKPRK